MKRVEVMDTIPSELSNKQVGSTWVVVVLTFIFVHVTVPVDVILARGHPSFKLSGGMVMVKSSIVSEPVVKVNTGVLTGQLSLIRKTVMSLSVAKVENLRLTSLVLTGWIPLSYVSGSLVHTI